MQIPTEFVSWDYLGTFAGMTVAVVLIVQFTKSLVKSWFDDQAVRVYAFIWSIIFVVTVAWVSGSFSTSAQSIAQQVLLCLVNAIIVTLSAMGVYEAIADPKAAKSTVATLATLGAATTNSDTNQSAS